MATKPKSFVAVRRISGKEFFMPASLMALAGAFTGIVLGKGRTETRSVSIIGDALIMSACVIAITAFALFLKDRSLSRGAYEIARKSINR